MARNRIEFWIKFNNGEETLQLPVNPEQVNISTNHQFDDIEVSQLGEKTIIGDENLKEFSLSSFLPRDYNPSFCEYENIPDPWTVIETLERWRNSKKPCRFIVTNTSINFPVTIRNFDYDPERAGNPGDIYFNVTLKEYRFVEFKDVEIPQIEVETETTKTKSKKERPNERTPGKTYTVQSGDTLTKIALKYQNQGENVTWNDIYENNRGKIGKNPDQISVGMELVIPGVEDDDGQIAVGHMVDRTRRNVGSPMMER